MTTQQWRQERVLIPTAQLGQCSWTPQRWLPGEGAQGLLGSGQALLLI